MSEFSTRSVPESSIHTIFADGNRIPPQSISKLGLTIGYNVFKTAIIYPLYTLRPGGLIIYIDTPRTTVYPWSYLSTQVFAVAKEFAPFLNEFSEGRVMYNPLSFESYISAGTHVILQLSNSYSDLMRGREYVGGIVQTQDL